MSVNKNVDLPLSKLKYSMSVIYRVKYYDYSSWKWVLLQNDVLHIEMNLLSVGVNAT